MKVTIPANYLQHISLRFKVQGLYNARKLLILLVVLGYYDARGLKLSARQLYARCGGGLAGYYEISYATFRGTLSRLVRRRYLTHNERDCSYGPAAKGARFLYACEHLAPEVYREYYALARSICGKDFPYARTHS